MEWIDHPENPLINPPWWSPLVGDPVVLTPGESPDGKWHLFANLVQGICHYVSSEGLRWSLLQKVHRWGMRPFVLKVEDTYYLYFQLFHRLFRASRVVFVRSKDLHSWSSPSACLEPTLPWEGTHASNACVLEMSGEYWMYYSASQVFLADMGFWEPKFIGLARSASPEGPWVKEPAPLLGPSKSDGSAFRNRGAGAIKVYKGLLPDYLVGFNNGIYRTNMGRSASAILLLRSKDGLRWEEHPASPIVRPTDPSSGWKRAQVYQMDVKRVGQAFWMYYNGRDGWRFGRERIGLTILEDARNLGAGWAQPPRGSRGEGGP